MDNLSIDIVPGTNYKIYQDRGNFSYGTDAIFLSNFAKASGIVMDLGTGTGIIPLSLIHNKKVKKIYGVEIQQSVADMAKKSIELNDLQNKIEILNIDLKQLPNTFPKHSFDCVVSNPPYMKKGGAIVNIDDNFAISRHEIHCSLEDIISVSGYLLKPLGKLFLVHRPDRLVDILCLMRQYKLEPKYIRFVQSKIGKKPNLLLIEAVKDAKRDLKYYDPLIVYNEDGTYTDEIYQIYGMER